MLPTSMHCDTTALCLAAIDASPLLLLCPARLRSGNCSADITLSAFKELRLAHNERSGAINALAPGLTNAPQFVNIFFNVRDIEHP